MDETEVTNSEYRLFVNYVRDSIARTLLAEAGDAGDDTMMLMESKYVYLANEAGDDEMLIKSI